MTDGTPPRAIILAPAGERLTDPERRLFAEADPLGFILFRRNVADPDQVRALVADLRETVGRADAPVLIDQEGGRVQRLRPPHWERTPAARRIGEVGERDRALGRRLAWVNARLIAGMLDDLGITVDCAPVLDLAWPDTHDVIGDRAFASDPDLVADLGAAACDGFHAGGVTPVIKHIPGHGRTRVDSHHALPVVAAGLDELDRTDFAPFLALGTQPWAMVAHVLFEAVDRTYPASVSPAVIHQVIRGRLGFDGLLVADDIAMDALAGSVTQRALATLAAGCDVTLHCSGRFEEMAALVPEVPVLTDAALDRIRVAEDARTASRLPADGDALAAELRHGLDGIEAAAGPDLTERPAPAA